MKTFCTLETRDKFVRKLAEEMLLNEVVGTCMADFEVENLLNYKVAELEICITEHETLSLLAEATADTEVFLCEECNWWCWDHEQSFDRGNVCAECGG